MSERLAALEKAGLIESKPAAQAAFGTIEKPTVRLSGLVDTFLSIAADRLLDKAPDQVRKYTLPRKRAVNNLVKVIGDKLIEEITRDDALAFREWWLARVQSDGIEVETANKDIGHLNGMINELDDRYRLGLSRVFERMRLRGTKKSQVPAFPSAWVQDCLLAPGQSGEIFSRCEDACQKVFVPGCHAAFIIAKHHIHDPGMAIFNAPVAANGLSGRFGVSFNEAM